MLPRRYNDVPITPRHAWTNYPLNNVPTQDPTTRTSTTVHWPAMKDCMKLGLQHGHQYCLDLTAQIEHEHLADPVNHYGAIAYNMLVCVHGNIIEGRTQYKESGANGDQPANLASGSVNCLVGVDETPTPKMLHAIRASAWMLTPNSPRKFYPHSHWVATQCPGADLTKWIADGCKDPIVRVRARIVYLTKRIRALRKRRRVLHELVK